jgi:hypothetical protein
MGHPYDVGALVEEVAKDRFKHRGRIQETSRYTVTITHAPDCPSCARDPFATRTSEVDKDLIRDYWQVTTPAPLPPATPPPPRGRTAWQRILEDDEEP